MNEKTSQQTWIVLTNSKEVKHAFGAQQLLNHWQKPVRHLPASLPTRPGSLYTCAANLKEEKTLRNKESNRSNLNFMQPSHLF